jgi:azurin
MSILQLYFEAMFITRLSFILLVLLSVSCGGENNSGTKNANGETVIEVKIKGNSIADMRFSPNSIDLEEGSKVKIILKNELKSKDLSQNWVLVNLGTAQDVVNKALSEDSKNDDIPKGKNIIAATPYADPSQSAEVVFAAPATGSYQYISTFPGSYPRLTGTLTVR